jgi:hypothetical protein
MLYTEYLKILNDNNIQLFDHEKRISFYNINYYKFKNEQTGGGYLKNNKNFKIIIDISLSSNPQNLLNLLN